MALIKDRAAPVFDSEQVHKGDLIRAKHKTWDEYKNGLVVGITSNELVVLYHTGIGNVSNHFVMLASEVAGGEWQGTWTEDMQAVQDIVPDSMTLEELIYTRLVQEKELAESLAKYEGVPAVFLQKAPDDKAQGWGVSQYPRADYLVDMTADPERHSSGMVSVNVYSDDTGKPPEELAPLVRIALCDVVMQADDGAYCITWARTELFEMNDSQNPNTLVNGCSLTFLLIAFPQQITQAPDPALAMQEFLKRWETDALVINKDHIESFYEPSDFHPAIYVRISGTKKKRQTCALTWMECSMAIHVIAPTPEARNSWTRYLYDTLARLGEIILLDGAPLLFDELAVDNAADYLTRGQITIKGQYATENFSEYSHPLKETYFNK